MTQIRDSRGRFDGKAAGSNTGKGGKKTPAAGKSAERKGDGTLGGQINAMSPAQQTQVKKAHPWLFPQPKGSLTSTPAVSRADAAKQRAAYEAAYKRISKAAARSSKKK